MRDINPVDTTELGIDPWDGYEEPSALTPAQLEKLAADAASDLAREEEQARLVPVYDRFGDVVAWRDIDDAPPS